MEIRQLFEATSSDWVRFSQYEIIEKDGVEWITPSVTSTLVVYNPLEVMDTIVVDMLNAGRLLNMEDLPDLDKRAILLGVVKAYGLMGFMTSIPLNGNFLEQPHVFFGRNAFFDTDMMDTREYLQYFQPFGIKSGQPRDNFPMPPALLTGKTLEYGIAFSRNYSEPLDWVYRLLKAWYQHFGACKAYEATDNPALKNAYEEMISSFWEYGLGFKMKMYAKPTMVWDFDSLKMAVETIYAVMISQENPQLKMCKKCGKAFYATHGRSEFCSDKCRNQFNVYKFRRGEKEKAEKM